MLQTALQDGIPFAQRYQINRTALAYHQTLSLNREAGHECIAHARFGTRSPGFGVEPNRDIALHRLYTA